MLHYLRQLYFYVFLLRFFFCQNPDHYLAISSHLLFNHFSHVIQSKLGFYIFVKIELEKSLTTRNDK